MTYASRNSEITLILLMIFSVCYNGNITITLCMYILCLRPYRIISRVKSCTNFCKKAQILK